MGDHNAARKNRDALRFTRTLGRTIVTLETADVAPPATTLAERVLGKLQYKPEMEQYLDVLDSRGVLDAPSAQSEGRRGKKYSLKRIPTARDFADADPPSWLTLAAGDLTTLLRAYREGLDGKSARVRDFDPDQHDGIHADARADLMGLNLALVDALRDPATRTFVRATTLPRRRFFAHVLRLSVDQVFSCIARDAARHPALWQRMTGRLAGRIPAYAALVWAARGGAYERIMTAGLNDLAAGGRLPLERLQLDSDAEARPTCLACGSNTPPAGAFRRKQRFGVTTYACDERCGAIADTHVFGAWGSAAV